MALPPTIHASAVLVGARAALIRGPSGSGKSRLALALVEAAEQGALPFARLVGDDRVHVEAAHGRLLVRPAEALKGLIEVRGLGIRRLPFESVARVELVVELGHVGADRLPAEALLAVELADVTLPRLPVAAGHDAFGLVLAYLRTRPDGTPDGTSGPPVYRNATKPYNRRCGP